jgi:hypothetical protein
MKTLNLIALTLITSLPAHAASKKSTYENLKTDAKEFVQIFENQTEECDYRVKDTRDGITISVKKPKESVVYVDVASDAKILHKGDTSPDDSYSHVYIVDGAKLEFVHADDAYDHVYVTKDGKTTSCELDY